MGLRSGQTPWNLPATTAPTGQAEEQQTAVRFEPATGACEAQQREPVSIFKLNQDSQEWVQKPQGSGSPGVSPCHVGKTEKIFPSQLALQEAFLTDDWDLSLTPPCATDAG